MKVKITIWESKRTTIFNFHTTTHSQAWVPLHICHLTEHYLCMKFVTGVRERTRGKQHDDTNTFEEVWGNESITQSKWEPGKEVFGFPYCHQKILRVVWSTAGMTGQEWGNWWVVCLRKGNGVGFEPRPNSPVWKRGKNFISIILYI